MQVIWEQITPISGVRITSLLISVKSWKKQTVFTLLSRLVKKGFLSSEKQGKERYYQPLVNRDEYLTQETERFIKILHKSSITGLMNAIVSSNDISEDELFALSQWLDKKKKEDTGNV
jgi:predicted transcriptional regulator